jgi:hypothetical protein
VEPSYRELEGLGGFPWNGGLSSSLISHLSLFVSLHVRTAPKVYHCHAPGTYRNTTGVVLSLWRLVVWHSPARGGWCVRPTATHHPAVPSVTPRPPRENSQGSQTRHSDAKVANR